MNCPVDRIIDAHHHLWQLDAVHYPWLMQTGVRRFFGDPTPIQKDYCVAHFEDDIGPLPVTNSVHIQVGAAVEESVSETRWLQASADKHGKPGAIVAFADLSSMDVDEALDAHQEYSNVRGVRQIVGRHASEDAQTGSGALLDDPTWTKNLGRLGRRGLGFDLQLTPSQLPRAVEVLRDCPRVHVALCHAGSPWDQTAEGLRFWRGRMAELAQLPNVYCKLSGFGMFDNEWTSASITPMVDHVLECFGVDRTMFGSNFPVDKLYRDYQATYRAYFDATSGLSTTERSALFFDTAARFYRIEA